MLYVRSRMVFRGNPWPFLVVSNMSSIIGSTKVGNAAMCFMVIADVFEKDCRLVPTIIFIITVFGGVIPGVLPGTLGMSPSDVTLMALIISLQCFCLCTSLSARRSQLRRGNQFECPTCTTP